MAAARAGPPAVIPALAADLGLGQIFDPCDALGGVGAQPFGGVQSCVQVQSYRVCTQIGSRGRLRKLGYPERYVEYDRLGVLVNDD